MLPFATHVYPMFLIQTNGTKISNQSNTSQSATHTLRNQTAIEYLKFKKKKTFSSFFFFFSRSSISGFFSESAWETIVFVRLQNSEKNQTIPLRKSKQSALCELWIEITIMLLLLLFVFVAERNRKRDCANNNGGGGGGWAEVIRVARLSKSNGGLSKNLAAKPSI